MEESNTSVEKTIPFPEELNYPREACPGVKAALSVFDFPVSVEVGWEEIPGGAPRYFRVRFVYPEPSEFPRFAFALGEDLLHGVWVLEGEKTGRILAVYVGGAGEDYWRRALEAIRWSILFRNKLPWRQWTERWWEMRLLNYTAISEFLAEKAKEEEGDRENE